MKLGKCVYTIKTGEHHLLYPVAITHNIVYIWQRLKGVFDSTGAAWNGAHRNKPLMVQLSVKVAGLNLVSDPVFVETGW